MPDCVVAAMSCYINGNSLLATECINVAIILMATEKYYYFSDFKNQHDKIDTKCTSVPTSHACMNCNEVLTMRTSSEQPRGKSELVLMTFNKAYQFILFEFKLDDYPFALLH